jgi:hypothetical protein
MADSVLDATVVAFGNGDIAARRPGNLFDRRLTAIEQVASGLRRLRYNTRLLGEYTQLIQERRNDVIELFFTALDDERSVLVKRNTLSRQDYARARKCRWPTHDQHLLAAAVEGNDPTIFVTESRHVQRAAKILTCFAVHIVDLG